MNILIFNTYRLEAKGGPSGYLYNLNQYYKSLKKNNSFKITFLNFYDLDKGLILIFEKILLKLFSILRMDNLYILILIFRNNRKMKKIINFDKFDIIHFHSTIELKKNINNLKNYKGKVILTSHSPELSSEEVLKSLNLKVSKIILEIFKKYDYDAFERSDYIIFPCLESMEPYQKDIKMLEILKHKKIKFIPTGILEENFKKDQNYFYNNYNIPKNAFIVSFVGRHNKIKGYDLAKEFAEVILKEYKDVYFVIAGKKSNDIKPLNNSHWIEIGWTNEGKKIIGNSHLYILPNRETYFDLVFLEALSMNSSILCSYTGGNKFFKKYNSRNIIFFSNFEEMVFSFKKYYEENKIDLKNNKNKTIFKENFSMERFYKKYIEILNEIKNEG